MPSAPRMSKRLSQAPRLSVVMAGDEALERKHESSVRDFFTDHIKTIVTLVMIFGTILCIVLIVMVHKWSYDSNKDAEVQACLDVAIIGAGVSGSYAAWRLRHDERTKISVFEFTDRAGGRLFTQHTPYEDPHGQTLKAEMGAMYYLPQRHPLLNRTIHALRLTPSESYPQSRDPRPSTFYFRDRHLTTRDIKDNRGSLYSLQNKEKGYTPDDLKRFYSNLKLDNIRKDPLSVKFNHANLYEMGYWNFLSSVSSREGFNFIQDGSRWRSHVSNGNAALLASLDLDTWDKQYTLEEGMDALPKAMLHSFENSSEKHGVQYNRRLACVHREKRGYYLLIFQKTVTRNGVTENTTESEKLCARRLILAISPSMLKAIKFTGFDEDTVSPSALIEQYLDPVPAMTAYFIFRDKWWSGRKPPHEDIITDLPVRQMRYFGSGQKESSSNSTSTKTFSDGHLFMVAKPDMNDVAYFEPLMKAASYGSVVSTDCNLTMQNLEDMRNQLSKMQGRSIPNPVETLIKDWREEPFGAGWHMWKIGVDWKKASKCLSNLFRDEPIYLVGGDVCSGSCQFWAEGALQTVDELFSRYNTTDRVFRNAAIAPLGDDDVELPSRNRTYGYV